jgi:pimeloyl-ACP methyl ester carboxylesterase
MSDKELAAELGLRSEHASVNGTRLHYVTGGEGSPLVLLPGWPQTWWSYHKVLPKLAERHRVIVVDLRGQGGSAKPDGGYDKKTMAKDIHDLIRHLGHDRVDVVGHDIGAMVAFSLAANHADTVGTVTLLDVAHPHDGYYDRPLLPRPGEEAGFLWWFAFNQVHGLPEQLLAGRSRLLIDHFVDRLAPRREAITDRDRAIYAAAYDAPGAIRASNGWYQAFGQDIEHQRGYDKVTVPVLALLSAAVHDRVGAIISAHAADVRLRSIDCGHFIAEEQPDIVVSELTRFLEHDSR